MANEVKISTRQLEVTQNLPVEVTVTAKVKGKSSRIGTLFIYKGSIDWLPKDHEYTFQHSWTEFDRLMRTRSGK